MCTCVQVQELTEVKESTWFPGGSQKWCKPQEWGWKTLPSSARAANARNHWAIHPVSPWCLYTDECRSTIKSAWTKVPAHDLYFPRFKNPNFIENESSCVFLADRKENLGLLGRTWTLCHDKYNSGSSVTVRRRPNLTKVLCCRCCDDF